MAVDAAGVVALASGVPLVVLGTLLLWVQHQRRDVLGFALFAILWGCQIVLANLGRILDSPDVHAVAFPASLALWPPAYLLLVDHVNQHAPLAGRRVAVWTAFGLGASGLAALVLDPGLVVSVMGGEGRFTTRFGAAWAPFFFVPFYGAFSYALVALYRRYRASVPGTPRRAARGHLAAFGLFASYIHVWLAGVYVDPPASIAFFGPMQQAVLVGTVLVGVVVVLSIVVHLLVRPVALEGPDVPLVAAFAVPAFVAVFETVLWRQGVAVDTLGLWRILMVAALVYALARNELFDLDLRLMRVAAPALAGLAFGLGAAFSLLWWVAPGRDAAAALPLVVGSVAAVGLWWFRRPLTRGMFPGVVDEAHYRHQRALDVYRAHLERSLARGASVDDPGLARLRRELGVHANEHRVLAHVVRAGRVDGRALAPAATTAPTASSHPGRAPRVAPGVVVADRYRVDRLLGEGAHGRAFLAHDTATDEPVVVKAVGTQHLGGRAATALLREARLLMRLDHPNIVRVHDVLDGPDEAVLVMAYAAGGNLHGLVARRGRLHAEVAVRAVDDVLAGLEAAHREGIVHRDVKPENVLLARDGRAMLADFGVARQGGPDATDVSGGAIGTLLYMSPEQVRAQAVDGRSDLYAVGVMLHVLLTGRYYLPLAGRDDYLLRRAIVETPPDLDLRQLPGWAVPILHRALAKDPEERFAGAADFRKALSDDVPSGATAAAPRVFEDAAAG